MSDAPDWVLRIVWRLRRRCLDYRPGADGVCVICRIPPAERWT